MPSSMLLSSEGETYKKIVEGSPDAIFIQKENSIIFVNHGALELLGLDRSEQLMGHSLLDFFPTDLKSEIYELLEAVSAYEHKVQPYETKILRADGSVCDVEMSTVIFRCEDGDALQVVMHDITRHKTYQEALRQQALHDVLTGLPNRALLIEHLKQAMALADRHKHLVYVLFFDLDRFKYINDTLGHDAGDELLKNVTTRILGCVRKSDTLARLGGDEFVLVLGGINDKERVAVLIQKMIHRISEPMILNDEEISVTCSVGLCVYPQDGQDVSILLKSADTAMYRAKEQGRNQLQYFSEAMHAQMNERLMMESHLRRVLERDEFRLYYQPVLDMASDRVIGAEALIRWIHPELDILPPARFITLAEETGLIREIGRWVLKTACLQMCEWLAEGMDLQRISVNVSAHQLLQPGFDEEVKRILQETGLAPHYLELEITESMSMNDPQKTVVLFSSLRAHGISIAIDDFGTGYSNLAYLKQFPAHRLKIDRSFIRDINKDPNDLMLTHAMIMMAHNLGLTVVAEGVEELTQLERLKEHGCDEIQGYYLSPPVPADAFKAFMMQRIPSIKPSLTIVRYPKAESTQDVRIQDLLLLLDLALASTVEEYGAYRLEPSCYMTEARVLSDLAMGVGIDVAWSSTSLERERQLRAIRIPLRKGILSYRIGLIHPSKQALLDSVHSHDDLKKLLIGQGVGWGDIAIYQASGIPIEAAPYPELFKMVASGYLDFFPRGINEVYAEYEAHRIENSQLAVESGLALYYPWPYYFFCHPNNIELATRIEKGLRQMVADGRFEALFEQYNRSAIQQARLDQRRLICLDNPFLPPETPLDDPALWFQPLNLSRNK